MPETLDFDQIALDLATRAGRGDILPHITDALRLVWNARGAADIETVNAACITAPLDDVIASIRSLDR